MAQLARWTMVCDGFPRRRLHPAEEMISAPHAASVILAITIALPGDVEGSTGNGKTTLTGFETVSYTHLDVYKRQERNRPLRGRLATLSLGVGSEARR